MAGRCAVVTACAIAPLAVWGQRIVDLGPTSQVQWMDVNDAGQIAGLDGTGSILLYAGGSVSVLGSGAPGFRDFGMNNAGAVAGNVIVGGASHAAVFTGGPARDLGVPAGATNASAYSINDRGQVTGTYTTPATPAGVSRAFVYSDGAFVDLGSFGTGAYPADINNSGQVVGAWTADLNPHAFLYANGAMSDLGALVNGGLSYATGMNDLGHVVGVSQFDLVSHGDGHAFLYAGGSMRDLGTLGGAYSGASDINERGQIVGVSALAGSNSVHAFIYQDGVMTDLNRYASDGWTFQNALDINNGGDILGRGTFNGVEHTFLLTMGAEPPGGGGGPVPAIPEPSTFALLGFGLTAVTLVQRRRQAGRQAQR